MRLKLVDRIVETLGRIGPASPHEIVKGMALGVGDHDRVRKALGRLLESRRVRRTGYGRYMLPAYPPPERLSAAAWAESEIVKFLTAKGGRARTAEIHEEIWGGDWEGENRPAIYGVVVKVLATSDRFEQVRHGVWELRGSI